MIGDPLRLRQIVVNLLGNAIKFTRSGEVALTVGVEEPQRAINDSALQGPRHRCWIPPEKQRTIFDAFTQADSSITRLFGGTGLGLTIASRLVSMLGGRIWVESEPGPRQLFSFHRSICRCPNAHPAAPVPAQVLFRTRRDPSWPQAARQAEHPDCRGQRHQSAPASPHSGEARPCRGGCRRTGGGVEALSPAGIRPCPDGCANARNGWLPDHGGYSRAERNSGRHQKIIALTAHAMKGDEDDASPREWTDISPSRFRSAGWRKFWNRPR